MIRRSWILIASILAAQFVCIVACLLWYAGWQDAAWGTLVNDHRAARNRAIAEYVANQFATRLGPTAPETASTQALRLRQLIAMAPMSDDWRVSVIDLEGKLIADQRLTDTEPSTRVRAGHWLVSWNGQTGPLVRFAAAASTDAVSGQIASGDGTQLIAAKRVDRTPYTVVVQGDPEPGDPQVVALIAPLRRTGLAIAVVLVLLSGLVTGRIVRRYESKLSVMNRELEQKVFKRTSALVQTRDAVVFGLARLAESRDRETGEHISRLQGLSTALARELSKTHPEIDESWIERLRFASALHDIGKVGIPDAVLLKPGPLTADERRVMQDHSQIGAECLAAIGERLGANDFLAMARDIALCHHEWWDGSGYPKGLRGAEIPLAARIVAVADVYDAASSTRVYKSAQSHERVHALIVDHSGRQFDPQVVTAYLSIANEFRQLTSLGPRRNSRFLRRASWRLPVLSGAN
ncbi:MAG: HD domain-containing protein [Phycisphaerae bacterium]|nr:HD domain-containing protein [Phycisphaerae bacterium]